LVGWPTLEGMRAVAIFLVLLTASRATAAERDLPTLAVLELEDGGANLEATVLPQLSEKVVNAFKTSARYRLVSPDVLKQRLAEMKTCDRACQAKLAKELRADKMLATRVVRIGSECVFTSRLEDLRSKKSEVVTQQGECSEAGLQSSLTGIIARLIPISTPDCSGNLGRATFASAPNGAAVFVNGVEIGTTPLVTQKLPTGCILEVRLVAPDGRERLENIKLAPNKVSVYRIPFE